MTAPILWAPGIFAFFLQENAQVHKKSRFRVFLGGGFIGGGGGGECRFYFNGRGDFSEFLTRNIANFDCHVRIPKKKSIEFSLTFC